MKRRSQTVKENDQHEIDFRLLINKKKQALQRAEETIDQLRKRINVLLCDGRTRDLHLLLNELQQVIKTQHDLGLTRPSSAPPRLNEQHTVHISFTEQKMKLYGSHLKKTETVSTLLFSIFRRKIMKLLLVLISAAWNICSMQKSFGHRTVMK